MLRATQQGASSDTAKRRGRRFGHWFHLPLTSVLAGRVADLILESLRGASLALSPPLGPRAARLPTRSGPACRWCSVGDIYDLIHISISRSVGSGNIVGARPRRAGEGGATADGARGTPGSVCPVGPDVTLTLPGTWTVHGRGPRSCILLGVYRPTVLARTASSTLTLLPPGRPAAPTPRAPGQNVRLTND